MMCPILSESSVAHASTVVFTDQLVNKENTTSAQKKRFVGAIK